MRSTVVHAESQPPHPDWSEGPLDHPATPLEGVNLLTWLLDYELRAAERYRRYATLLLIFSPEADVKITGLFGDSIRTSDKLFELERDTAVLMGETDTNGAMAAVNRFKTVCRAELDLRFAVASYPFDGRDTAALMHTAHRRLRMAKEAERGAVIHCDS